MNRLLTAATAIVLAYYAAMAPTALRYHRLENTVLAQYALSSKYYASCDAKLDPNASYACNEAVDSWTTSDAYAKGLPMVPTP